jgi:AcrR family transcriptional regulator
MTTDARPARGTRPANRRELIVEAATELFRSRGYEHVAMGDIADAVAVGSSALYRHFPGKLQLLVEVVRAGIEPMGQMVDELDLTDPVTALPALARISLDHRDVGVLFQREVRHLAGPERKALTAEVSAVGRRLAERVAAVRPELTVPDCDLLAWSMLAVVLSPSYHQLELPRAEYEQLLARLAGSVLDARLTSPLVPGAEPRAGLLPRSRREVVLAEAVRLFAERRYASVSLEDVAAAVGIAGPSIYNHVPSKIDLLLTPFQRGTTYLMVQLTEVLADSADPATALRGLVGAYVHFAFHHHDLVELLISEVRNLPADEQRPALAVQREYIDEWVHLVTQVHPELDATAARIQVQAALSLVNDAARTRHIRTAVGATDAVAELCEQLLELPAARRV